MHVQTLQMLTGKKLASIVTPLYLRADTDHFYEWLPDFSSEMSAIIKDLL